MTNLSNLPLERLPFSPLPCPYFFLIGGLYVSSLHRMMVSTYKCSFISPLQRFPFMFRCCRRPAQGLEVKILNPIYMGEFAKYVTFLYETHVYLNALSHCAAVFYDEIYYIIGGFESIYTSLSSSLSIISEVGSCSI